MNRVPAWEELRVKDVLQLSADLANLQLDKVLAAAKSQEKTRWGTHFNWVPAENLELDFYADAQRAHKKIVAIKEPSRVELTNHDPAVDEAVAIELGSRMDPKDQLFKKIPWAEPIIMPFVVVRYTDV